ncbi:flavodoxin family protein [Methanofollis fontis]|uniref:Flavodoxin family protein n=1 Tax=Methanofollis fontis TaxID=2052832 RepID=A0A483CW11_9EURY|nr:flavodoxin family protein [Methanofollis fontis]TAJ45340.1 flavodoxin family protein [Methanofollis fontis]
MAVKVLGISGSPHRRGNTETLLDAFLHGAEEAGGEVRKVVLRDLAYSSCRGCNACHKNGRCVVKDDLTGLFEEILAADVLAIASPIYSMGITADLKGLIDRAQYLWAQKFVLKSLYFSDEHIRLHKGVFLSTAGQAWDHVFDSAYPMVTAFFNGAGFEYYDNVIANNMDEYGGIRGHPTALAEAEQKGGEVVEEINSLQTTGQSVHR